MAGRPEGWRKPDARRYSVTFRVHMSEKKALKKLARRKQMTESECFRWMLYKTFPPLKWGS